MTGNTNKTRAVFLAMLMVFSVFAGTVAFSGSAAADAPNYEGNAVHYQNSSGTAGVIEVPFDGEVAPQSVTEENFSVLDDGDNVTDSVVDSYRQVNSTVIIHVNRVIPSEDIEVDISEDVVDVAGSGNTINNPGEKSVVFAGQTLEHDTSENGSPDGGSDSQARSNNVTAYQGVTIAVNASNVTNQINSTFDNSPGPNGPHGNIPVTVEGEDNNYFQEGNVGTNSTVFTFDTSDRELGKYRIFLNNTDNRENRTFVNVRDLGLDIAADELNVTTSETIETDVSAVAGNRNIEAVLLDSNGDEVTQSSTTSLDGQGEADVDFDVASADGGSALDTGTYTVEVTDNSTGITVATSEITVSEADDEEATFTENTITEERGDILEITVEMTETSEATINFGSDDDGVEANVTVEDDNDDDQVTVFLNTYRLSSSTDLPNRAGDAFALDSDSDDNIVDQDRSSHTLTSDLIDAGDYDLEVEAGDQDTTGGTPGISSSDDVATVTLNPRSTESAQMWTGSSDELTISDLEDVNEGIENGEISQSTEIAVGDLAVHQLQVTGLEGALDARANERINSEWATQNESGVLNLTIEEADPGANQNAAELNISYGDNATVIADGPNDTYFVVVDTGEVDFKSGGPRGTEALPNDDDTALETNFTIVKDDAGDIDFAAEEFDDDENEETLIGFDANEPEINIDEPFNVSQASGQTVTGDTNIAPGTELSLRVRSQSGVSPSFLKTADPVVQSDGTYSATFDFSEQNVGDEYDIQANAQVLIDGPQEESGEVVEAVATDTATPEPDTETATPEPDTATPEPDTATPEPDTATPEPDTATPEPDTDTPTSTPTSTPGFGVIVALTALLAAALLAVRRES
jgi:surface glycoprotein (TIGR04207 family)/PGF-CTERM protein